MKEIVTFDSGGDLQPTEDSCDGLRRAAVEWTDGCKPSLCYDDLEDTIYMAGCHDSTREPVRYCPYCGRLLEVSAPTVHPVLADVL